jgi:valyl-tRNA synthetase
VRETFFRMFRDGYIYRGKRLVNWDTQLQTSVADDETYTLTTKGGFWTFKYEVIEEPRPQGSGTQEPTYISFSTTRPETMLADTALCVHPDDERYKHLVGKKVRQPHTGREIPIIADGLLADMTLGTGCVKVTPAHDPNDYACWQRNPHIGILSMMNPDGTIPEGFGEFSGLDRLKARDAVVARMEEQGLFVEKTERDIPLPYSDRSKTPIEPLLSDQWFVKMGDRDDGKPGLAQLAIDAVTSGKVKFVPERYARTYLDWLGEKRDWCISRQLWWGHRIPVWTYRRKLKEAIRDDPYLGLAELPFQETASIEDVAKGYRIKKELRDAVSVQVGWFTDKEGTDWIELHHCPSHGQEKWEISFESKGLTRSEDVLDTWFSSALWPHSTLGWPEPTPELGFYYPTSVLVTSRDIITLWVARMVMTGLYNVGDIPFHTVYIHPKILDGFGETMSKTKGNGLDPLDIIEIYGTDALRFGMAITATETQDSRMPVTNVCPHCGESIPVKQEHMYMRTKKLSCPKCKGEFRPGGPWPEPDPERPTARQGSDKFDQGRNFANKLWNAARFLLLNLDGYTPAPVDLATLPIEDRWILSRLNTATRAIGEHLENFRFAEVARTLYDFTWSEFCDWYVEMSKNRLRDEAARPLAQRVLAGVLDGILRLAQPVMPFVTESIWQALNEAAPNRGLPMPGEAAESVCIAPWPSYPEAFGDAAMEARLARMQDLVRLVREVRNRYMVDTKTALDVFIRCSPTVASDFQTLAGFIQRLGGVGTLNAGLDTAKPRQAATQVHGEFELYVSLEGLIDVAKEIARLQKQQAEKTKALEAARGKLNNAGFLSRAQPEVVQATKDQVTELETQLRIIETTLADLQQA